MKTIFIYYTISFQLQYSPQPFLQKQHVPVVNYHQTLVPNNPQVVYQHLVVPSRTSYTNSHTVQHPTENAKFIAEHQSEAAGASASFESNDAFGANTQTDVLKTKLYEIRRPALQKHFYDIEERIIVRPAGSALLELNHPISKTEIKEYHQQTTPTYDDSQIYLNARQGDFPQSYSSKPAQSFVITDAAEHSPPNIVYAKNQQQSNIVYANAQPQPDIVYANAKNEQQSNVEYTNVKAQPQLKVVYANQPQSEVSYANIQTQPQSDVSYANIQTQPQSDVVYTNVRANFQGQPQTGVIYSNVKSQPQSRIVYINEQSQQPTKATYFNEQTQQQSGAIRSQPQSNIGYARVQNPPRAKIIYSNDQQSGAEYSNIKTNAQAEVLFTNEREQPQPNVVYASTTSRPQPSFVYASTTGQPQHGFVFAPQQQHQGSFYSTTAYPQPDIVYATTARPSFVYGTTAQPEQSFIYTTTAQPESSFEYSSTPRPHPTVVYRTTTASPNAENDGASSEEKDDSYEDVYIDARFNDKENKSSENYVQPKFEVSVANRSAVSARFSTSTANYEINNDVPKRGDIANANRQIYVESRSNGESPLNDHYIQQGHNVSDSPIIITKPLTNKQEKENQKQFIKLLTERNGVAEIGPNSNADSSYHSASYGSSSTAAGLVHGRVISATPAPHNAQPSNEKVNIRRVVFTYPTETVEKVHVIEDDSHKYELKAKFSDKSK